eukprot:g6338.t1
MLKKLNSLLPRLFFPFLFFSVVAVNGNADSCVNVDCSYHGICSVVGTGHLCDCDPGYTGDECEQKVDFCASADAPKCLNGGKCISSAGVAKCNCDGTGFMGSHCFDNVDDCAEAPEPHCGGVGVCVDKVKDYECKCEDGFVVSEDGHDCIADPINDDENVVTSHENEGDVEGGEDGEKEEEKAGESETVEEEGDQAAESESESESEEEEEEEEGAGESESHAEEEGDQASESEEEEEGEGEGEGEEEEGEEEEEEEEEEEDHDERASEDAGGAFSWSEQRVVFSRWNEGCFGV